MTTRALTKTDLKTGRIALRDGATLLDVAKNFLEPEPDHTPGSEMIPFPAVPRTPILTAEDKAALARLPEVFGKVLVEERRSLKADEIAALHEERKVVKQVVTVLAGREGVINENIRHHVDVDHEERGVAVPKDKVHAGRVIVEATPRDASGHYIFASQGDPTRVHIPDTNEDFSLEYRKGSDGGVQIDANHLLDLLESEEITRAQYLALTREVRVFDEAKARQAILKDETLLEVIAKVTRRVAPTKPGTSLFVRKSK